MTNSTKHCNKCHETKPVDFFHKKRSAKDGLSHKCKSCEAAYNRTPERKAYRKAYNKSPAGKAVFAKFAKTPKAHAYNKIYRKKPSSKAVYAAWLATPKRRLLIAEYNRRVYASRPEVRAKIMAKVALREAVKLKAIPLRAYIGSNDDERKALMTEHHASIDDGSKAVSKYVTEAYRNSLLRAENLRDLIGSELFPGCVMTIDHWIPLAKGGEHHPDNFKYIMPGPLNSSKNDQLPAPEGDWQLPAPQYDRVTWRTLR